MAMTPQRGRETTPTIPAEWQDRRDKRVRTGGSDSEGLKLPIPDHVRDKYPSASFEFYWFTGTTDRLDSAKRRDWHPVDGEGTKIPGATDKHGNSVDHVLCVKPRDWYDADRGHREASRLELEENMRRGNVAGRGDDAGQTLSSDVSYASASNRLR